MKVSVSLPDEDVEFLNAFAKRAGASRSAAVHRAVLMLRTSELGDAYADAWSEWDATVEAPVWDAAVADGLAH